VSAAVTHSNGKSTASLTRYLEHVPPPPSVTPDPVLQHYAQKLRRELEMVERQLRGEPPDSVPPESHMG
jgi:hypothetical protein